MTDVRRVWPRQPLEAKVADSDTYGDDMVFVTHSVADEALFFTGAEFAEAFIDAAIVGDLIDAARDMESNAAPPYRMVAVSNLCRLLDALAAYDAAMTGGQP